MDSRERFYSSINYEKPDRLPVKYYGNPEIDKDLMEYLNINTFEELRRILGDDFRGVYPRYIGPERHTFTDGSWEGLWGERYISKSFGAGAYDEAVYLPYKDITAVEELEKFIFPSSDWYDYSYIKEDCEKLKGYAIVGMAANSPDFINGIARCRGVEQVLMDIALEDPVYIALVEKRFEFYYETYRKTLQAANGLIDIVSTGDDFGSQSGLLISPKSFDRLFAPKLKSFFDLAHEYGAKAMMHCCGSNRELIPRFIELGLDILEVVQVDAEKMNIVELHRDFYKKIAFCGSISVQSTLPFGTPEDVSREVDLRKKLFSDGGLIIAPTHHLQAGTPVENVIALYQTAGSINWIH